MIAVIDTGVDLEHPDLDGQLLAGNDWLDASNQADDRHGHGTLVAGIAAAATDNGEGVAGVAPEAKILPLRIFDENGQAQADHAVEAINFAMDRAQSLNLIPILNLSFDWSSPHGGSLEQFLNDPEVNEAVEGAARDGAAVIVAAGNSGGVPTAYDATEPGIMVVGYSDSSYEKRHPDSSYGAGLDILAPGDFEPSTYWDPEDGQSKYARGKGSSMAVPFVSGTVAILMAGGRTNDQAIERIKETAKDLGPPGRDDQTGHGFLDAAAALDVDRTPPPPPSAVPSPLPTVAQPSPSPSLLTPSPEPEPSPLPEASPDPLTIAETPDEPLGPAVVLAQAVLILGVGMVQLHVGYRRWRFRRG